VLHKEITVIKADRLPNFLLKYGCKLVRLRPNRMKYRRAKTVNLLLSAVFLKDDGSGHVFVQRLFYFGLKACLHLALIWQTRLQSGQFV
jgi:hypothetical protein